MKTWQKVLLLAFTTIIGFAAGIYFGYTHSTRSNSDGCGLWAKPRFVFFSRDIEPGNIITPADLTYREMGNEYRAYSKPQIEWFNRELISVAVDYHSKGFWPNDLLTSIEKAEGKKTRRKVKSGQIVSLYDLESADSPKAVSK